MIRITRTVLAAPLATRMAELGAQIGGARSDHRSTLAKELWRKTATRNAVCTPLKLVLSEMAPGCPFTGWWRGGDWLRCGDG
jgi:hypothetical protein